MRTRKLAGTGRAITAAAAIGVALLAASPAFGQFQSDDTAEISPPRPGKADDSAPIVVTYLLGIVLIAAAVGANLIPSKRGHQD